MIRCLKFLAEKHKISIVLTIHQPNSDILMMFEKLYVIAKGGKCIYFGPPNQLDKHLINSNINRKDIEIPIEVLIKMGAKGGKHLF